MKPTWTSNNHNAVAENDIYLWTKKYGRRTFDVYVLWSDTTFYITGVYGNDRCDWSITSTGIGLIARERAMPKALIDDVLAQPEIRMRLTLAYGVVP